MIIKVTMLFNQPSAISSPTAPVHRLGGWSESVYYDGPGGADLFTRVTGAGLGFGSSLCSARARLLPVGASITGQRYQLVDPTGRTQTGGVVFPGSSGQRSDVPQMALLCSLNVVGYEKVRRLTLRGIPDANVNEGEYSPQGDFNSWVQFYFTILSAFSTRINAEGRPVPLMNISALGIVSLGVQRSGTLAIGNSVRIINTHPTSGYPVTGVYTVNQLGPLDNQFGVSAWGHGISLGGSVSKQSIRYALTTDVGAVVSRVVVRKVGRPFVQYVGRRSNRR